MKAFDELVDHIETHGRSVYDTLPLLSRLNRDALSAKETERDELRTELLSGDREVLTRLLALVACGSALRQTTLDLLGSEEEEPLRAAALYALVSRLPADAPEPDRLKFFKHLLLDLGMLGFVDAQYVADASGLTLEEVMLRMQPEQAWEGKYFEFYKIAETLRVSSEDVSGFERYIEPVSDPKEVSHIARALMTNGTERLARIALEYCFVDIGSPDGAELSVELYRARPAFRGYIVEALADWGSAPARDALKTLHATETEDGFRAQIEEALQRFP